MPREYESCFGTFHHFVVEMVGSAACRKYTRIQVFVFEVFVVQYRVVSLVCATAKQTFFGDVLIFSCH
jgi:hypothetical protein